MQVLVHILIVKGKENPHETQDADMNKLQKILVLKRSISTTYVPADWGLIRLQSKSLGSSQTQVYFAEAVGTQLCLQHEYRQPRKLANLTRHL